MYKIDQKYGKEMLSLLESAVNSAARDPNVKEEVEYALETFRQEYIVEKEMGYTTSPATEDLLNAVADCLGFRCYDQDPLTPLAWTLAEELIKALGHNDLEKRNVPKAPTKGKTAPRSDIAPSLMDNDMDADAYNNEGSYYGSGYGYPSHSQGFGRSHSPELDDPRLKRVLRKKS